MNECIEKYFFKTKLQVIYFYFPQILDSCNNLEVCPLDGSTWLHFLK